MHTTPIKSENVYLTFSDLYKKYIPAATIFFEGDIYERKENGRHKNTIIHYYRCENELHTLIIRLKDNNVPYLIEGIYSRIYEPL
ncbi:hypothetical protein [Lysinibacillus sp. OL1]|uniref:hypothetical protein n=1 Tax=Lysinibacillus sp. OL1 TaxID=2517243 RepID=UPI00103F36AF|nr:hypothetical protein [Lysinibacillus sp. OL1]TBV85395.1 hypothetical protein EW028_20800 [Lysinibacillus sp. OL1]